MKLEYDELLSRCVLNSKKRPYNLDPDLLLQCAELFISQESGEPQSGAGGGAGQRSAGIEKAMALLEAVCRRAPGLMAAQLLLMRTRYVAGEHDAAARTANAILRLDEGCADAHLILSQIHLSKGNHRSAQTSLDNAISNNFTVGRCSLTLSNPRRKRLELSA